MPVQEHFIPAVLAERARRQPDDIAYTFIDYDVDPAGFAESLTWSQLDRRARNLAHELLLCGSVRDRAAILAPQGLDYIVAFFGAMQAGLIAVPLPAPQPGGYDERVSGALRDCSPAVILTTSAVVADVMPYADMRSGTSAPRVIEIDALDLESPRAFDAPVGPYPEAAYLQYTSGSTRQPSGVVVTHRNVIANLDQIFSDYFEHRAKLPPADIKFVSWLPFFHDMGMVQGVFAPLLVPTAVPGETVGRPAVLISPVAFLQKPARWMQLLAANSPSIGLLRRTSRSNWRRVVHRTTTWPGWIWAMCMGIISGSERIHAATIRRFTERFARFNLPADSVATVLWAGGGDTVCGLGAEGHAAERRSTSTTRSCRPAMPKRCDGEGASSWSATARRGRRRCGSSIPETRTENPAEKVGRDLGARRQCRERLLAKPTTVGGHFRRASWSIRRRDAAGTVAADRRPRRHVARTSCSSSAASRIC